MKFFITYSLHILFCLIKKVFFRSEQFAINKTIEILSEADMM